MTQHRSKVKEAFSTGDMLAHDEDDARRPDDGGATPLDIEVGSSEEDAVRTDVLP